MKAKCEKCDQPAVWIYMPKGFYACDNCVPRGCSCNARLKDGIDYDSPEAEKEENWIEEVGDDGRKFPCCEWLYSETGFDTDEGLIEILHRTMVRIDTFDKNEN